MHHGTCVTHVPWCMSGSLTCGDGENVPGIPGACAPTILRIWQEAHSVLTHLLINASANWVSIGSGNDLSLVRHQAINWTNAALVSIGPLWTNFTDTLIEIQMFSFKNTQLRMSSAKWRPFCARGDELNNKLSTGRATLTHKQYVKPTRIRLCKALQGPRLLHA